MKIKNPVMQKWEKQMQLDSIQYKTYAVHTTLRLTKKTGWVVHTEKYRRRLPTVLLSCISMQGWKSPLGK